MHGELVGQRLRHLRDHPAVQAPAVHQHHIRAAPDASKYKEGKEQVHDRA